MVAAVAIGGLLPVAADALGNERNGIALVVGPDRTGFATALRAALKESGRFSLVAKAPPGLRAKPPALMPDPPITVPQRNLIKGRTTARWLLFLNIGKRNETIEEYGQQVATYSIDVLARTFDIDMGDYSQLMNLTSRDPYELAAQTMKYLRVAYPLQGNVTAVRDGTIYLDLGKKDGVDRGSYFVIRRRGNAQREKVGTVLITSSSDWYAVGEVNEQVLGKRVQAGDAAVEDASAILAQP
ncbi:MAG: hypothetical protein FJZ00_03015 [Candidatus Sericytochromatia bacterium]|uniref:Uncharacterized protein n=1 Tax=Candidatus Tanganyikabacteria bacterium TaxID=2961651 RepID=A0A938BMA9_9BACT|nr:hypothetical protein [Candidatus Tanganyikabacteria bacterium]